VCGILGYYLFDENHKVDDGRFLSALRMMSHRGPDDEGVWKSDDGRVCLGHRRLSIIDLSANGHQPMISADGNFIISYNGEIYNYKDIKQGQGLKDYTFRTNNDTETLLASYIQFGNKCLNRFRGMFSFAIYDKRNDKFFFARDRMGIKPFYYTLTSNGYFFSSEIKPLFEISGVPKRIRKDSVLEYFAFGKVHSPFTMFENIMKLPAAHCGLIENGKLEMEQYWTPYSEKFNFTSANNEEGYSKILFELFEESVRYRLVSDVPIGIFLSGGVDSTGILGMINHLGRSKDIFTYSAGFEGQDNYDERIYAKKAAEHYGSNHREILIKKEDLIESLPEMLGYIDEPVSDSTIIPIFFLSKLAREKGSIVILNGDGADELFAGYSKWQEYIKFYKFWNLIRYSPGIARSFYVTAARLFLKGGKAQIASDIVNRAGIKTQFYIGDTGALKGTSLFYEIIPEDIYNIFNYCYSEFSGIRNSNDYVEWMSYWGLKSMVENVYLYRADRMGMANSIEIRVPYLDHKIVEFGMQMPQGLKHRNKTGKYLLKKSLERIVPEEFLYRKKMGFCVPVSEWAGKEIREDVFPYFYSMNSELRLFDEKVISEFERLVSEEKTDTEGSLLMNLHIFTNWYRQWFN